MILTSLSYTLLKVDAYADYVPVISSATNLIDLFLKCITPYISQEKVESSAYFTYLKDKSTFRCVILMFPTVVGNIFFIFYDIYNKHQGQKLYLEGKRYEKGNGVKVDINTAIDFYRQAGDKGNGDALNRLGKMYEIQGKYTRAVEHYQKAILKGHAESLDSLGLCYFNGNGVRKWDEYALFLFDFAIKEGYAFSHQNLALYYLEDINGYPRDLNKAVKHFQEGARHACPESYYSLGYCYVSGYGVPKNEKKGIEYILQAVSLGNAEAMLVMAAFHTTGQIVAKDSDLAIKYYRQAAALGNEEAIYILEAKGIIS